jgi:acyl-CoA thioesterase I
MNLTRRTFLAAAGAAAVAGCAKKRPPFIDVTEISERRKSGDPIIRIACIGDSITYGAGVEDREKKCYPIQLGEFLGARFDVKNLGHSGATLQHAGDLPYWTTDEFKSVASAKPDVIILMLGTNDTKPQNWKGKEPFKADYIALVRVLMALPSKPKIWACLPPPVYGDKWGINAAALDLVIEAIQEATDKTKTPLIDLNDTLTGKPEMFPDQIHPNAAGATLMAKTVYQAIRP